MYTAAESKVGCYQKPDFVEVGFLLSTQHIELEVHFAGALATFGGIFDGLGAPG
jgi:hypothetical protein